MQEIHQQPITMQEIHQQPITVQDKYHVRDYTFCAYNQTKCNQTKCKFYQHKYHTQLSLLRKFIKFMVFCIGFGGNACSVLSKASEKHFF